HPPPTNLPGAAHALSQIQKLNRLQPDGLHPFLVVTCSAEGRTQEAIADGREFSGFILAVRSVFGEPGADRHAAAGSEPAGSVDEESRLVEQVLSALNAPNNIEAGRRKCRVLGILAEDTNARPGAPEQSSEARPGTLHWAERQSGDAAAEVP